MAAPGGLRFVVGRASVLLSLAMCLLVGCHGGTQTDIIERELRWQENQIYALEDYLMEYQAKVRRLREENDTLAQSLAECEDDGARRSSRGADGRERTAPRTLRSRPPSDVEDLPTPAPTGFPLFEDREPPGEDAADVPEVTAPDLPPEEQSPTTWIGPAPPTWIGPPAGELVAEYLTWITTRNAPGEADGTPTVAAATDTEPLKPPAPVAQAALAPRGALSWISGGLPAAADELQASQTVQPLQPVSEPPVLAPTSSEPVEPDPAGSNEPAGYLAESDGDALPVPTGVVLEADLSQEADGEVLGVTVTPLTADDRTTDFYGAASLMLRDPAVAGPEGRLARWDFDPDQVAQAWHESPRGDVLRFTLPLEEPLPSDQPIALWVRLQPGDDAADADSLEPTKILDHLRLRVEGAKGPQKVDLSSGQWAVALPGKPALLENRKSEVTSAWRSTKATAVR